MTFHFNEVCDCGREGQHPNAYLCKYELSIATAIASKQHYSTPSDLFLTQRIYYCFMQLNLFYTM